MSRRSVVLPPPAGRQQCGGKASALPQEARGAALHLPRDAQGHGGEVLDAENAAPACYGLSAYADADAAARADVARRRLSA
jgi:hypothetical protein